MLNVVLRLYDDLGGHFLKWEFIIVNNEQERLPAELLDPMQHPNWLRLGGLRDKDCVEDRFEYFKSVQDQFEYFKSVHINFVRGRPRTQSISKTEFKRLFIRAKSHAAHINRLMVMNCAE